MPIVTIRMLEGRDKQKKKKLIKEMTKTVKETLEVPEESIRIIIHEIPEEHWGIAGLPIKDYLMEKVRKKR